MVNEYGGDELDEDSKYEKRIAKAVATAKKRQLSLTRSLNRRGGYTTQSLPVDFPSRAPAR